MNKNKKLEHHIFIGLVIIAIVAVVATIIVAVRV